MRSRDRASRGGRPTVVEDPVQMTITVARDMRDALTMLADDRGMTRSALTREVLLAHLTKKEN